MTAAKEDGGPCPELEALLAGEARAHAELCDACAARLAEAERVEHALADGPLAEPPRRAVERATALAEAPRGALAGAIEYVAELLADSFAPSPRPALRAAAGTERHLLYTAGPFRIDVTLLEPSVLVGQCLAVEGAMLERGHCTLQGEERVLVAPVEDNGDFRFEGVEPGTYDLVLEDDARRLVLPSVDLAHEERDG